nr:family 20 glycosylhydrolase [Victivallales bacterium]
NYRNLKDNDRVLNALLPETFDFVSKLISEASEPYKSKIIHLGMDETWGIGRGASFTPGVPVNPRRIYAEYVAKVAKICDEKGLKPVIWGDFVLGRSGEAAMSDEEISLIPKNVTLNYWNYHNEDETIYERDFDKIKKSGFDCISSPGLWTWSLFFPDVAKMRKTAGPMMNVIHRCKMDKVMMTLWGDDGSECLLSSCWLALSYFFAACRKPQPEEQFYKLRAERICKIDVAKFAKFEVPGRVPENVSQGNFKANPRMFFYEDPLTPLCCLIPGKNDRLVMKGMSKFFGCRYHGDSSYSKLYQMASLFCAISSGKIALAQDIKKNYPEKRKKLKKNVSEAKKLAKKLKKFHHLYRSLWLEERKPFGLEEMDFRLAGLSARLEIMADALKSYLKGKIHGIPEFESEAPFKLFKSEDLNTARKLRTKSISIW